MNAVALAAIRAYHRAMATSSIGSASSSAYSGLQAAQARLDASAHNVANVLTEDARRVEVRQTETESGGVTTEQVQTEDVQKRLEEDLVAQIQSRNAYEANLQVFRTADRVAGALLDEQA